MLILIHGEDQYRSLRYLQKLRDNFIGKFDKQKLNIDDINFNEKNNIKWPEVNSLFNSPPFLAEKRLIILRNFLNSKILNPKNEKLLIELIPKLKDYNNIIIFYEEVKKLDARKKITKLLNKELEEDKGNYKFPVLEGFALNKWIKTYIKEKEGLISDDGIKTLAALIGPNLWQQEQEINKLIAYKNGERICPVDIELLSDGKYQDYIFKLIDKISAKDLKEGFELLEYQLNRGQELMAVWHLLIRQFRLLTQTREMLNLNMTKADISRKLKVHPYVVTQMIKQAQNFELKRLKKIYKYLYKWEEQFKTNNAKISERFLMELFIISI